MKAKRILFYLEPVTYANSPLRLGGWWSFFSAFAHRSSDYFISHVASSPFICELKSESFEKKHQLNQIELLKSSDFDRALYSLDLCQGFTYRNRQLINALNRIKHEFRPDIVISVTDNRYLKKVFGQDKVMFMELGPLPRSGMKLSVYVDPYGHQIRSTVDRFAKANWDHPSFAEFADIWQRKWVDPALEIGRSSGLTSWLNSVRGNKKIMLAALQPNDWITYEGISSAPDPVSVLRRLAARTGNEWAILPQWHSSDTAPSDDLMDELAYMQPNILYVPGAFRIAQSEPLLPLVDAIATISSNVAAAGVILGKEIKILGKSKFNKFSDCGSKITARYDLLAFLSNRYCRTLDEFMNVDGAFADHVLRLIRNPNWLLDQNGLDALHLETFFPFSSSE